ncbi:peptidoglycan-binding domain-containing protein [Cellulomonas sp. S1-8]|uniref:peptidoglycan-binding domain-containing protein n=1 Tax=Cellulomonas sp. S1-8 TaxID=2904790 RepID=UPI0022445AF3|nr:peptidoglycan-binding protein [Cellulomonas sp. S1-8]UZN03890.1 peptidoglycan-binding protein [Cellulomonas sp. S1-8]
MSRRSGRDGAPLTAWVVLTGLLVVPVLVLGGWWAVARADNPTRAAAQVEAVVVPVTHSDVRAETGVTIKLGDAPGRAATTSAAGTVTSAPRVGAALDNGVEVLRVDDRPVRAMVSAAPPWRALAVGDSGPDVARLQEFLTTLGLYEGPVDGKFGPAVRRAVEQFNVEAGLGRAVAGFDPATVVWVGPTPTTVAEALVTEGTAVAPGVPVLSGPARHDAVVVLEPQGGIATSGDFGGAATLTVGAATVAYAPGSGSVDDAAAVEAVRAALAPATEGTARVAADQAREVAVVPASALVQGADGTLCVYGSPDEPPVEVAPVGGGVGSVQLGPDLPLTEVVSNPGRVGLETPCGS